jgi:putative DNA primase/helicase
MPKPTAKNAQQVPAETSPTPSELAARFDDVPLAEDDDPDLTSNSEDQLAIAFTNKHHAAYKHTAGIGWMRDDGQRWCEDDRLTRFDAARRVCRSYAAKIKDLKLARKVASSSTVNAIVTLARSDVRMALSPKAWDADPHALNTPAGVVDLRAGSIRPRSGDFVTQITAVSADPRMPSPAWDKFLKDVFEDDEDVIEFIQRMFGYMLTGSIEEQKIFFLQGPGANGKSVLIDLIGRMIGTYSVRMPSAALMLSHGERHPTEIAMLRGKRLAISSELEEGAFWAEARLKELTGDEITQARFMRGDFFEFRQTQKHVIVGNYKPRLRGGDAALARRFVLVPFNAVFSGPRRDNRIGEKLWSEAPAILAWAIRGAVMWRTDGLHIPDAISSASSKYMADNDDIATWVGECCVFGESATTKASTLYESFSTWIKARGQHAPSMRVWGDRMTADVRLSKKLSAGVRYVGVRLTQDEADRVAALSRPRF